ncbi:Predicted 5' DNA nuclease, flap endonuclease-1-like, helix-3-turn-helix (H3TH) domain [Monaibacterium marinum]|uniref:Predicted 5' DNA nuclease, flap endonuclease-1-like, helix-3-turn-helix (H3TH) domain n=1 Tax=Pontivivens marinum TaxID=1690039 RepID=A0A2C9CVP8_9RHOB|nr:Predicted 5' DNA nuclease, flap endonuclease-1-like, helix-3-turn-helix (H3TH) domain [Monaibacterium marinum]
MSDQNPFTASKLPFAMLVSVALSFVLALVLMFILELSGTIAMFAGLMILIVVFALLIYFLDEPAAVAQVSTVADEPVVAAVEVEAAVEAVEVVVDEVEAAPAADGDEKPVGLDAPRDGTADDLKLIKGVGPKLEALLNSMGFWHFDQVAAWTAAEISWVDENLEGFKGRVTRDEWVWQAGILAEGGTTAFAAKADKGGKH